MAEIGPILPEQIDRGFLVDPDRGELDEEVLALLARYLENSAKSVEQNAFMTSPKFKWQNPLTISMDAIGFTTSCIPIEENQRILFGKQILNATLRR